MLSLHTESVRVSQETSQVGEIDLSRKQYSYVLSDVYSYYRRGVLKEEFTIVKNNIFVSAWSITLISIHQVLRRAFLHPNAAL
jgi:hypothetical protein